MSLKIKELVEKTGFRKENYLPYLLTSLMLPFQLLLLMMSLSSAATQEATSNAQHLLFRYFAVLAMGYVLGSSYLSYRATKLAKEHLFLSGISTYVQAREMNNRDAVLALFKSSLVRRDIPSPITSLILNLITLGLFFPILLHILELNIRRHARGEETIIFGKGVTGESGFSTLLLDLSAVFLTLGVYMVLRTYRFINIYNKHVENMHLRSPTATLTQLPHTERPLESPLLSVALILIGTGIYALLSLLNVPVIIGVGYFFALPVLYVSYSIRNTSVYKQVAVAYAMIYLVLCSTMLLGFLHIGSTLPLVESSRKDIEKIHNEFGNDLVQYFNFIFMNNFAISFASMISIMNPLILFNALSNSGIILGGVFHDLLAKHGHVALITLVLFLVWPHVLLELLSYGVFLVTAVNIDRWRWWKILTLFIIGVSILAAAALVESLTIIIGTVLTQRR